MKSFRSKNTALWALFILLISMISGIIGNYITGNNIVGGTILILILISLPFLIEIFRKKDPILYYGLDFDTLRKINIKEILAWALGVFLVISLADYLIFDLWNIIMNNEALAVGSTSTALARSNVFYLAVIVVFSGTFLEEIWFRGIIQTKVSHIRFMKKVNPHAAIFLQSVLFGLVHYIPIHYGTDLSVSIKIWFFVYPFLIGVVIGYLNEKYHSLWPGWIIHYTNNLLSVILLTVLFRL